MADETPEDLHAALARADASYRPIPTFDAWVPAGLDHGTWEDAKREVEHLRRLVPRERVDAALRERVRAAAVDTGALEGLYRADSGFTWSIATGAISMAEAGRDGGPSFERNFEAQLEAFDYVLDIATNSTPITEVLIRQIHEVTCAGQPTHQVWTNVGWKEHALALGEYKSTPNSPQTSSGEFHAYAPVSAVPSEMERFVAELRSESFRWAHPVEQAAYAHHAFTHIHPFADGNGRVARLLGTIWLVRGASIPLWVRVDDRDEYLAALRGADEGRIKPWVQLVSEVSLALLRDVALALQDERQREGSERRTMLESARASADRALRSSLVAALDPFGLTIEDPGAPVLVPGDVDLGAGQTPVVVPGPGAPRWVAIGIDWAAEADGRYVAMAGPMTPDPAWSMEVLRVRFSERELLPVMRSSAKLRIDQLVRSVVEP